MWDEPGAEYFLDGRNATAFTQPRIDDHQVRIASKSGGHSGSLGGRDCANLMAHLGEHVGNEHADQSVVLHHQDAEGFHRFTSPPVQHSFTRRSI
jgi:hypothetical protein